MTSSGKKTVYLLIGPPGVGKSTWAETLDGFTLTGSDKFIDQYAAQFDITYTDAFGEYSDLAMKLFKLEYKELLERGEHKIVVDRTNMSLKTRRPLIQQAKANDYRVVAVFFKNTFWSIWAKRLKGRAGKSIPASAIGSMILSFEEPNHEEGFDEIVFI